jgi:hypothetical protein
VRWDELFQDLEAQLEAAEQAGLAGEIADRTRRESASVTLVARLRAHVGCRLALTVQGVEQPLHTDIVEVAAEWLLVREHGGRLSLIPTAALLGVTGLGGRSVGQLSVPTVTARLGLAHALRGLSRDRAALSVVLVDGSRLTGTLDTVGSDFVDLAEHPLDQPRRGRDIRAVRCLPMSALALLRS